MDYDVSMLDYSKYYYFIDDNQKFLKVDKNINNSEFNDLKNNYFFHDGSKVFDILFGIKGDSTKNSFYKFLILDFGVTQKQTKSQVLSLLNDLLVKSDVIELKGKVVVVYYQELDLDFDSILDSINLDFFTNIKMFQSGKMYYYRPNHFSELFNLYIYFLESSVYAKKNISKKGDSKYIDESKNTKESTFLGKGINYNKNYDLIINSCNYVHLVLLLISENSSALKLIRPIILNKLNNDSQIEKIINSMLNNNLNVSNAAKDLYMHRNTLNNKLEYIKRETNLNIQRFKDAMAMYWLINAK